MLPYGCRGRRRVDARPNAYISENPIEGQSMAQRKLSPCMEQVRRSDKDRFLCNLFAPPEEREALAALCALNIELAHIREAVREPLLGRMRLAWWSEALDAVWAGRPPRHHVAEALADAVRRFGLGRRHLDRMLDGRARDLDDRAPGTLASLVEYAAATSGALAEAGLEVLGVDPDDTVTASAARDVGTAWALIGLVRAVPFHARGRRLYLPEDLNRGAGLDAYRLFDRGLTAGVTDVCEQIVSVARDLVRQAREKRRVVSRRALPVLLPAVIADRYVAQLERAGWDPFAPTVQRESPFRVLAPAMGRLRGRY